MESQTEIQKETQKTEFEISMPIEKAIEFKLLREDIRQALKEFWEWYKWHYAMPVNIELGMDYMTILIEYDITEEVDECVKACIEKSKKEFANEDISEEDIRIGCYDMCDEEVSDDINAVFNEVWTKLWPILNKYGMKYDWEMSWDQNTKYLRVDIKF
jgi:hypothetical protein